MTALISKELKSVFCSVTGLFFSVAFLVICGIFLWFFGGSYNILDGGYADLGRFFSLAPAILIVLIPALTMRLYAEEKRSGTFLVLKSYPVRMGCIWFAKFAASLALVVTTFIPTLIYVYSLYVLASPAGNIDLNPIWASYLSLILLSAVFISIGLFASAATNNQVTALILGVVLCAFSFYGFELVAKIFSSGKMQAIVSSAGLLDHYSLMQRGVISLRSIFVVFLYLLIFYRLPYLIGRIYKLRMIYADILVIVILVLFVLFSKSRVDFTSDKRYTISGYTDDLLGKADRDKAYFEVKVYLYGDLNPGFLRLKDAAEELLGYFRQKSRNAVNFGFYNPYKEYAPADEVYGRMYEQDMPGIALNEVDREGKLSRKIIYPYAQVINDADTLVVSLLKNVQGYTAEENLNASIESLEYEFADALRLLSQKKQQSVAFIEGHGELPREYVLDAEELLSRYYSVHRGQIGNQPGILDDFDVVIVAGPSAKYGEEEKFVLDQYIMSGGRVLWLVDGAYTPVHEVFEKGYAASVKQDANLDDMLFTYGVRINADFVQDKQCTSIMLVPDGDMSRTTRLPCYYMPLLMPSSDHIITRNIRDVKTSFASSLSFVNNKDNIKKTVLLTTSGNTHLVDVPEPVSFDVEDIQSQAGYFDQSFIPVAVALEGSFGSVYTNRLKPEGIEDRQYVPVEKSRPSKMVVVSSSKIIANELEGRGDDARIVPMGYDRVSKQQFGNPEFIVNAVNWLTGDEELMALRVKHRQMYLLDKNLVYAGRDKYAALNTGLPVLFILLVIGGVSFCRKRKYER